MRALGFVAPRLRLPSALQRWQRVLGASALVERAAKGESCCAVCAPTAPTLTWARVAGGGCGQQHVPVEDPYLAGCYERALKERPPGFELQTRRTAVVPSISTNDCSDVRCVGELRVAVNATSLATRAFAALPRALQERADDEGETLLEWRVIMEREELACAAACAVASRPFTLSSNRRDAQAAQTAGFLERGSSLRPEQLRSLTWMRACESLDCEPFVEEEVVDERLSLLEWRAEAKVSVPTQTRRRLQELRGLSIFMLHNFLYV